MRFGKCMGTLGVIGDRSVVIVEDQKKLLPLPVGVGKFGNQILMSLSQPSSKSFETFSSFCWTFCLPHCHCQERTPLGQNRANRESWEAQAMPYDQKCRFSC